MNHEPGMESRSELYVAQRAISAIAALPLTAFALLLLGEQVRSGFDPMGATFGACSGTMGALCWWFALAGKDAESRSRIRIALLGGFLLGAIGFAAGFFGPIILTPSANQGPLIGIFFSGPLGFALGVLLGALYASFRAGAKKSPSEGGRAG